MPPRGKITVYIFLTLFAVSIPSLTSFFVYHEIQKRLKLEVSGRFRPAFFYPSFEVQDARFEWKGKVRLLSGHVKVEYDPLSLVGSKVLRVKITSRDAEARLVGEWADLQGAEEATIDRFKAELGLSLSGLEEIYFAEARSPEFEFLVEKSLDGRRK